jgi:Tetracyclin repressor-like, C-terminal domain
MAATAPGAAPKSGYATPPEAPTPGTAAPPATGPKAAAPGTAAPAATEATAPLTAAPGVTTGDPARVLRAQILLAAALGMTLLRSTVSVEPLAAATEEDLHEPLSKMVNALLAPQQY